MQVTYLCCLANGPYLLVTLVFYPATNPQNSLISQNNLVM